MINKYVYGPVENGLERGSVKHRLNRLNPMGQIWRPTDCLKPRPKLDSI